jgi:hypothetical protein
MRVAGYVVRWNVKDICVLPIDHRALEPSRRLDGGHRSFRAARKRRVRQTEHTAGGIQEGDSKRRELSERLDVGPACSGGFSSEHFWIDGHRTAGRYKACGPVQGATAEKAVPFPSAARRS